MERRAYLRAIGCLGLVGVAGCVESIDDSAPVAGSADNETPTDEPTPADEPAATATPEDSTAETAGLEHAISIFDPPGGEPAAYEFTVTGDLEQTDHYGATIDDEDNVDGSTATGHVWGMMDSYRFTGEIVAFEVSRDVKVVVDGQEIEPEALSDTAVDPLPSAAAGAE